MRTILIAVVLFSAPPAFAEGGPFGLGLVVGEPTGVTGAYRMSDRLVIDVAVGIDLFDNNRFYVHADLLFVLPDLLGSGAVSLSPYLGPGAFVTDVGELGIGARAPFGLSLDFRRAPLQIYLEVAVAVLLVPQVDGSIGGALGFRYYF